MYVLVWHTTAGIAAAVGGIAAGACAKAVIDNQDKRSQTNQHGHAAVGMQVSRPVVDKQELPPVTLSCEEF